MNDQPIRVEHRVMFGRVEFTLAIVLPPGAATWEVARAVRTLDRHSVGIENSCQGCGTPPGTVHTTDCPLAPEDFIESLRAAAVREGMPL